METKLKISFIAPAIGKGTPNAIAALPVFKKAGLVEEFGNEYFFKNKETALEIFLTC